MNSDEFKYFLRVLLSLLTPEENKKTEYKFLQAAEIPIEKGMNSRFTFRGI